MISVIVLGTGNVGSHLIDTFLNAKDIELVQVFARKKEDLQPFAKYVATTTSVENLKKAAVYIIAISDDAIPAFSSQLPFTDRFVVHTSGSVSLDALQNNGYKGIFYPLQTFSKHKKVDFSSIPICIEAERKEDIYVLEKLANSISDKVFEIDSKQRKFLHTAAVFSNNFVNHLYKIAADICKEHHIPFEILHPLILETAQKITKHTPSEVQTGPASRNDIKTMNSHLELLSNHQKNIYKLLTQSIQKEYGKEL